MNISEVIKRLEYIRNTKGELSVFAYSLDNGEYGRVGPVDVEYNFNEKEDVVYIYSSARDCSFGRFKS